MVHQHHHLILIQVGIIRINKSELIDFQFKERLTLSEQVVDVDVIEPSCLLRVCITVILVPEHNDILRLLTT